MISPRLIWWNLFYLSVIFLNFLAVGWLLNGYGASKAVWLGTLATIAYVVRAGSGGTALASVWIVGIMSLLAVHHVWFRGLPRPEFRYIPFTILANWCFFLWVIWLLGKYSDFLAHSAQSPKYLFLILWAAIAAGITIGWNLYINTLLLLQLQI